MHKKNFIVILIVLGVAIIAYPTSESLYYGYQQKNVIEQINSLERVYEQRVNIENSGVDEGEVDNTNSHDHSLDNEKDNGTNELSTIPVEDIIGIIQIPSIELYLPLFSKIDDYYLQIGPCKMESTSNIGEIGNCVIAGHRNYRYGDQFNRLNELMEDDIVIIEKNGEEYRYTIEEKFIVEASEMWVTDDIEGDKVLTLITCHPIDTGEKRLIIRGRLQ
ncbi:class D sortase [Vallitalea okinawensis]|uniref:class D sortase n=1 Tax=Vallitalea okinawensis TaxID=2078660 RepID=UPI000CFDDFB4|nr:class D sortase [Vallitalea okinawensis]